MTKVTRQDNFKGVELYCIDWFCLNHQRRCCSAQRRRKERGKGAGGFCLQIDSIPQMQYALPHFSQPMMMMNLLSIKLHRHTSLLFHKVNGETTLSLIGRQLVEPVPPLQSWLERAPGNLIWLHKVPFVKSCPVNVLMCCCVNGYVFDVGAEMEMQEAKWIQ